MDRAAKCKKENVNLVDWLISEKCPHDKDILLLTSCQINDIELFKYIINLNSYRDNNTKTKNLYQYAVQYGAFNILNWLFQHGFVYDRENICISLSEISLNNEQPNTFRWLRTIYKETTPIDISIHIKDIIKRVDESYMEWVFDSFEDQIIDIVRSMHRYLVYEYESSGNRLMPDVNRLQWSTWLLKKCPLQLYPEGYKEYNSEASQVSPFILLFQLLHFPLREYSVLVTLCGFLQLGTIFKLKEEEFVRI